MFHYILNLFARNFNGLTGYTYCVYTIIYPHFNFIAQI